MTTLRLNDLEAYVGREVGVSDWLKISQNRINEFAKATGDYQWIHVDTEKAKYAPFGTTIAHGFLILSLAPYFAEQIFEIEGVTMGINYGTEKVRFVTPVTVNSRVRMRTTLSKVERDGHRVKVFTHNVFELEEASKPACVADLILMLF